MQVCDTNALVAGSTINSRLRLMSKGILKQIVDSYLE
jgi:hypothetical protein